MKISKKKIRYKPQIFIYRGLFYIKKKFNKHVAYKIFYKRSNGKSGWNVYNRHIAQSHFAK